MNRQLICDTFEKYVLYNWHRADVAERIKILNNVLREFNKHREIALELRQSDGTHIKFDDKAAIKTEVIENENLTIAGKYHNNTIELSHDTLLASDTTAFKRLVHEYTHAIQDHILKNEKYYHDHGSIEQIHMIEQLKSEKELFRCLNPIIEYAENSSVGDELKSRALSFYSLLLTEEQAYTAQEATVYNLINSHAVADATKEILNESGSNVYNNAVSVLSREYETDSVNFLKEFHECVLSIEEKRAPKTDIAKHIKYDFVNLIQLGKQFDRTNHELPKKAIMEYIEYQTDVERTNILSKQVEHVIHRPFSTMQLTIDEFKDPNTYLEMDTADAFTNLIRENTIDSLKKNPHAVFLSVHALCDEYDDLKEEINNAVHRNPELFDLLKEHVQNSYLNIPGSELDRDRDAFETVLATIDGIEDSLPEIERQ